MIGGLDRYSFNCWKTTAHSLVYSNPFHLCSRRKKRWHLSTDLEINRFKAVVIPVSFCTSFGFGGACKLLMALIYFGFTSIPLWVTMYPKNLPKPTPKEHFETFKHSLCSLSIPKMLIRSSTCSDRCKTTSAQYCSFIVKWWQEYRPQELVVYFWQIPKLC